MSLVVQPSLLNLRSEKSIPSLPAFILSCKHIPTSKTCCIDIINNLYVQQKRLSI
jgi:hypothetical protein